MNENHSNEDLATINERQAKTAVRPASAKFTDFTFPNKQKAGFLQSAKLKANKGHNDRSAVDVTLLNKLKPRQINIDKERLYEENLDLKKKSNAMQEEMVKLKTKLLQIEREMNKKEDSGEEKNFYSIKPPNLIMNLKNAIKELKTQVQSKDEEIETLCKNLKSSKINELEAEVKAYTDECTRLKRHLEENLCQNGAFEVGTGESERLARQTMLFESMAKEKKDLVKKLKDYKNEVEKLKQKLLESKGNKRRNNSKSIENYGKIDLQRLRSQNEQLLESLKESTAKEQSLREELKKLKKALKDQQNRAVTAERSVKDLSIQKDAAKKVSKKPVRSNKSLSLNATHEDSKVLINYFESILKKEKITCEEFFSVIDRNKAGKIPIEEFVENFKKFDRSFSIKNLLSNPEFLSENEKFVNIQKLQNTLEESRFFSKIPPEINTFAFDSPLKKNEGKFINLFQDQEKFDTTPVDNGLLRPCYSEGRKSLDVKSGPFPDKKSCTKSVKRIEDMTLGDDSKSIKKLKSPTSYIILDPKISAVLKHICYRMQINRLSKAKLPITLFGSTDKEKVITKSNLISFIIKSPFVLTDHSDQETLSNFLLTGKSTVKSIIDKLLQCLPDWKIFSIEDEADYDAELGKIISKDKQSLMAKFKAVDSACKGIISSSNFLSVLSELNISLNEDLHQYIQLLCYSYDNKLDNVHYRYLIKAYGNLLEVEQDFESEYSENSNPEYVSYYLGVISQILTQSALSAADVFEYNEKGLIFPDQFIQAIQSLGMEDVEIEYIFGIIEAVRCKSEKELCVQIQEFETALLKYYEKKEDSEYSDQRSSNRINLFTSGTIESNFDNLEGNKRYTDMSGQYGSFE